MINPYCGLVGILAAMFGGTPPPPAPLYLISTPAAADLNPVVLLLRNTNATREFFKDVRKLSENHKALKKVCPKHTPHPQAP